ncbi:hypothetical protein QQF64_025487 [Cirrhinus molitorella]|uniref:Uncharacterized protein n=1 Tax=Cirrhinus molitorella TaxID=172907 RepID=A0ABR3NPI4_9TELE
MQFTVAQQVSGIKTSLERDTHPRTHTHRTLNTSREPLAEPLLSSTPLSVSRIPVTPKKWASGGNRTPRRKRSSPPSPSHVIRPSGDTVAMRELFYGVELEPASAS